MKKKFKKQVTKKNILEKEKTSFFERVKPNLQILILAAVFIATTIYFFAPYVIDGNTPLGTDVVGSQGRGHIAQQWSEETGELPYWNPGIFCGMPNYMRHVPQIIQLDTFVELVGKVIYSIYLYLFIGALGIFLLLKYKKIPWYICIIIAVAFVLLPDWQALVGEGHFAKLRTIMVLPLFVLSFNYFFDKNSWVNAGIFALIFSWLIRAQHIQIIFYGILLLLFVFIYPFIQLFIEKKVKYALSLSLKFIVALALAFMVSALPFLTLQEYTDYSTRGGNPVQLGEEKISAKESGGVDFDYATQWSLAPSEVMDFFIPRFHGGYSSEIYDGDKYPNIVGQNIPAYWGDKPFNGNYATMGIILFLFAIIGVIYYRKDKFIIALSIFTIFSVLLSFGKHFPALYAFFYYNVPFFSTFRAPSIMASITFLTTFILAGFGLKAFFTELKERDFKWVISIFGIALGFVALLFLFKSSFGYTTEIEATRYDANTIQILKDIRQEFLTRDLIKVLVILVITGISVLAFLKKKIKLELTVLIIFGVVLFELISISNRAFKHIEYGDLDKIKSSLFKDSQITDYLIQQEKTSRAIVLGNDFTSNYYSYFYPTINGYSPIKLQAIQDAIEHNLYNADTPDKINWNLISMLNGKYVIIPGQVQDSLLIPLAADQSRKEILYENMRSIPKAWFIKEIKNFNSYEDIVLEMNKNSFNPKEQALLRNAKNLQTKFSGEGNIEVIDYKNNHLYLKYKTDSEQFLVISEMYYPLGWKAFIDDKEVEIFQVNYLIRGVVVPAGEHNLNFIFHPQTYFTGLTIVWIGNILMLLLIIVPLIIIHRDWILGRFNKKKSRILK